MLFEKYATNKHSFKELAIMANKMAKAKSSEVSRKISFGKKGTGKHKRNFGPKEQKPKKYRGQGR